MNQELEKQAISTPDSHRSKKYMQIINGKISLDDEDLKEIFSLFCSPTRYEVEQIYSNENNHFYLKVSLQEEYSLVQEKREFSIDAWRSVLLFLYKKGFVLVKDENRIDLSFVENEIS